MFRQRFIFESLLILLLTACSETVTPIASLTEVQPPPSLTPAPTSVWEALQNATPIPHDYPLADSSPSLIDGVYAKVDQSPPQWWTCYRCADYRPAGGIWRLQFDKGVMRIFYEVTNWKSIASATVTSKRLKIFNDPFCPHDVGEYEWKMENGLLTLDVVNDACAFDLRRENLVKQAWTLCPPKGEQPEGCADPHKPVRNSTIAKDVSVTVTIQPGDSHYFEKRPDLFAAANPEDTPSPAGIQIDYHPESIDYGTHRVLWWKGDWIEAGTNLPFTSIGVQFWGSGYLGWARVLFDGAEVWRGLTTSLGKQLAYYGGFIEITNFQPGHHVIRVENLGFDYHPIKVAAFGFSNHKVEAKSTSP